MIVEFVELTDDVSHEFPGLEAEQSLRENPKSSLERALSVGHGSKRLLYVTRFVGWQVLYLGLRGLACLLVLSLPFARRRGLGRDRVSRVVGDWEGTGLAES